MEKSPDAFRTISEVAEWLDIPTHVLRFWESRFSQIKPVKRAGGRRYYRPSDMRLIGGVKVLLHDEGHTIRAVQKTLREQGIKHVSEFSPPLDGESEVVEGDVIDAVATEAPASQDIAAAEPAPAARGTRTAQPDPVQDDDDLFAGLDDMDREAEPAAADADEGSTEETAVAEAASEEASADDAPPIEALPDEATPVEVPPAVEEPAGPGEDAPIMFRRASRPPPEEAPEAPEEAPVVAPSIPDTPDIPASDPSDDDPAFAAETGVAARITAMSRRRLRAHPDAIAAAHEVLSELRDRLG